MLIKNVCTMFQNCVIHSDERYNYYSTLAFLIVYLKSQST